MGNKEIFFRLKSKYYYLNLNELDIDNIVSVLKFNSYQQIDNYLWKAIGLILNNNYVDGLISIDRNNLLCNYINCELSFSDDLYDNIFQLKKLNVFYDMVNNNKEILSINYDLISSNRLISNILKNVVTNYSSLNINDSYLTLLIDSYLSINRSDVFESVICELGDNYSIYSNELMRIKDISDDERNDLLARAKNGDSISYKKFIESNLKLVLYIALRYRQFGDLNDLIQSGNIGLMEAYDKFDINLGYRFSTYAIFWIRREIIFYLNHNYMIKIPSNTYPLISKIKNAEQELERLKMPLTSSNISKKTGIDVEKVNYLRSIPIYVESIDSPLNTEDAESTMADFISSDQDVEQDVFMTLDREKVLDIIDKMLKDNYLNEREQKVLLMKNGFINNRVYTFLEIGNELNVSKQRVEQIYKAILSKIRKSKYLFDFAGCLDDEKIKNKLLNRRCIKNTI